MQEIVLAGYGGHAQSVVDCIESGMNYKIVGYTDMKKYPSNYPYLGTDDVLENVLQSGVKNVFVALGYMGRGNARERLYTWLKEMGFFFPVIADPTAIISRSVEVGEGTFVGKGAVINANAKIGKMCIINTKSLIEHECCVEDYTHVSVGAVLCGQVHVGPSSFIGANATIIQETRLPGRSFIRAGEVVKKR